MPALRYLYLLALAVWLGGAVVLSVLDEYIGYLCGATLAGTLSVMAVLGPRPLGFVYRLILVAAMLIGTWAQFRLAVIAGGLALLAWEARDHSR